MPQPRLKELEILTVIKMFLMKKLKAKYTAKYRFNLQYTMNEANQ